MPGDGLTHGPPAKKMQAAGTTGAAVSTRHSLRDGLTAYTWSPWCAGLFGHHPGRNAFASRLVDTSIGVSGHHDFTVRIVLFVRATDHAAARHAHRSPGSTFVTIAIRPSHEPGIRGNIVLICPTAQVFFLRQTGTTGNPRMADMR